MTTLDALWRQRVPRRPGESIEEWEARIDEAYQRPGEPLPMTPDAISARNERRQRALRPGTSRG
jgi:hypothetical protein